MELSKIFCMSLRTRGTNKIKILNVNWFPFGCKIYIHRLLATTEILWLELCQGDVKSNNPRESYFTFLWQSTLTQVEIIQPTSNK